MLKSQSCKDLDELADSAAGGWVNPFSGVKHIVAVGRERAADLFPTISDDVWRDYTRHWEEHPERPGVKGGHPTLPSEVCVYDRIQWRYEHVDPDAAAAFAARDAELVHVLSCMFRGAVPAGASATQALHALEQPKHLGGEGVIITSIDRIQNMHALADYLQWKHRHPGGKESMVMHGTDLAAANAICSSGFRARFNKNGRAAYGIGNYATGSWETALAYARTEGLALASSARSIAAYGSSADPCKNMYSTHEQTVLLVRMAHGPVEAVGTRDAKTVLDPSGKPATLYTSAVGAHGGAAVYCAPEDAQMLVQYRVRVWRKLFETSHWTAQSPELYALELKPLLLMRWRLHQVVAAVLLDTEHQQGGQAKAIIEARLKELESDWAAMCPVLTDIVSAGRERITMPGGARVDGELAEISAFFEPQLKRAERIAADSKLKFRNLSGGDTRFAGVTATVHVGLPPEPKQREQLASMAGAGRAPAAALGGTAAGAAAGASAGMPAAPRAAPARKQPERVSLWSNLTDGDRVTVESSWKGFDVFVGMSGTVRQIWKPALFQAVDFLVQIDGAKDDAALQAVLRRRPNQNGAAFQDALQQELGEPVLRCRSGHLSPLASKTTKRSGAGSARAAAGSAGGAGETGGASQKPAKMAKKG